MITGISESKTLTELRRRNICEKDYIWNLAAFSCKNGKDLANIMDDSVIMFDKIIDAEAKLHDEELRTILTSFNEKRSL